MIEPLVARALDATCAWLELGCDVIDVPSARVVRAPRVLSSGYVSNITATTTEEIGALLTRVAHELDGARRVQYRLDHRTPPQFEARLALEPHDVETVLQMLLEDDLPGAPPEHDVRPVETDERWRDWFALNAVNRPDDDSVARARRLKCPPVRYWLAYADGEPAGFFSSWEGIDGVGVTENLHVREEYRGRGIAAALMHRCVEDARSRGARAITLGCNPDDWPKTWYARLGFKPIGMGRIYTRQPQPIPASSL